MVGTNIGKGKIHKDWKQYVALLLLVVLGGMLYGVKSDITAMRTDQQVQGVIMAFYAQERFKADSILCAGEAKDSGICRMVTFKSSPLGEHNDLWMMFDAGGMVDSAMLDKDKRQNLTRIYVNLARALNQNHALDEVFAGGGFPDIIVASDWYAATMAQAMVCKKMPETACVNGLPQPVGDALRELAMFVQAEGPRVAAYETNLRISGVEGVLKNL